MKKSVFYLAVTGIFLFGCEKNNDNGVGLGSGDHEEWREAAYSRKVFSEPGHNLIGLDEFDENGVQFRRTEYALLDDSLIIKDIIEYELDDNYVIQSKHYYYKPNELKEAQIYDCIHNDQGLLTSSVWHQYRGSGMDIKITYNEYGKPLTFIHGFPENEFATYTYYFFSDGIIPDSSQFGHVNGELIVSYHYVYDANNKLISEQRIYQGKHDGEHRYSYDPNTGLKVAFTIDYFDEPPIEYRYVRDQAGRITEYHIGKALMATYEYSDPDFNPIFAIEVKYFPSRLLGVSY